MIFTNRRCILRVCCHHISVEDVDSMDDIGEEMDMATSSIHKKFVLSDEQVRQINETPPTKIVVSPNARKSVQLNEVEKSKLVMDVITSHRLSEKK
jgi:hypothetical protein